MPFPRETIPAPTIKELVLEKPTIFAPQAPPSNFVKIAIIVITKIKGKSFPNVLNVTDKPMLAKKTE